MSPQEQSNSRNVEWRRKNLERARRRDAKYRLKFKTQRTAHAKQYRLDHPDYFRRHKAASVLVLKDWYVRQKAKRSGRSFEATRRCMLISRTRHSFIFLTSVRCVHAL